ncbi:peptidoglycan-binding domain-containing protein [Cerasicoccus fimbriatus]|uniref:peptidoglycan-binding domain-containing protein n=1 Tax=Cerasicoccus fimbriatus TaxID=3014554 RepID=UPI0022B3E846|nr:peptidoglycan-binding domain-containing protein [Cerasicoccus sp. TK19100]
MNKKIIITCAAGIVGVTAVNAEAEESSFFDDVANFFTGESDQQEQVAQAEYVKGPGDHEGYRNAHKAYPKLPLKKAETIEPEERYEITAESKHLPFPEEATVGECYAEMIVPAKFETVTERVLQQEASSRIDVTAAQYEWQEQKVMVKPAETRLEVVPAQYKTVSEKVMIEPARTEKISIPATYKTVSERVLVRPATKVWMDGEVEVENPNELTGDIVCLVEKPAEYKTVTRQVVDQPARTEEKTIPAQYKTVQKQVMVSDATTREITIPAQYDTVQVRTLKTPEKTNEVYIEPQYANVSRDILIEPAHTRWERVLCDDTISPELAWEVESRLNKQGFNPGAVDGNIDASTEEAIEQYQMANNLPMGGLTPATLQSLGIVNFKEQVSAPKVAKLD